MAPLARLYDLFRTGWPSQRTEVSGTTTKDLLPPLPRMNEQHNQYNAPSTRTSTLMRYAAVIPCGICKKSFDSSQPRALFAHIEAHFDRRYRFNRCEVCQINFVTSNDLASHLTLASKHGTCGFMFRHSQSCNGHHPPRVRRTGTVISTHGRNSANKDDNRFDFCYRLRRWELTQLAVHSNDATNSAKTPTSPDLAQSSPSTPRLTGLRKLSFFNHSEVSQARSSWSHASTTSPSAHSSDDSYGSAGALGAALLRAICAGSVDLVAAFVYAGANPHILDAYGFGSMHYAARYGSPGIVRILLRADVPVDQLDRHCKTPLAHAIMADRLDLVECFLCLGSVICEKHLRYAVSVWNADLVKTLLEHWTSTVSVTDVLDAMLLAAVKERHLSKIELLLSCGAEGTAEDSAGDNALSLAVALGDKEIVQLLLDHGVQLDYIPGMQYHLMQDALKYRHLAMVELLLSKGAVS